MRTISFTITDQQITSTPISDLIGNTKNYVKASFTFNSVWNDMLKVAIFTANSKQYPQIIENNECIIPAVVMSGEYFDVGVYGGAGQTRLTTGTVKVRVEESVRQKPPYDMISMYEDLADQIESLAGDVETAEETVSTLSALATEIQADMATLTASVESAVALAESVSSIATQASTDAASALSQVGDLSDDVDDLEDAVSALDTAVTTADTKAGEAKTTAESAASTATTASAVATSASETASAAATTAAAASTAAATVSGNLTTHEGLTVVSETGVHCLRYYNQNLQIKDPTTGNWTTISSGGGGGTITIDDELSSISPNAVKNSAITAGINAASAAAAAAQSDATSAGTAASTAASNLTAHIAEKIASQNGAHGLRYNNQFLQIYNTLSSSWDTISTGGGGEERLDRAEQNILALVLSLTLYQQAEVTGTSDNIVVEVFDDTTGYVIAKGAYDSTNHRVYA